MEIKTISEMGARLGVHVVDDKAILIEGSPLCVVKTSTGIFVCEDDEEQAREIFKGLGLDEFKVYTCNN